jgi:cytochrome c553
MKVSGLIFGFILSLSCLTTPVWGAMDVPSELLGFNAGSNDNPHNLSKMATHGKIQAVDDGSIEATQICTYCHTPHGATAQSTLWNRRPPTHMGSFPLYDQSAIVIGNPAISATSKYKLDADQGAGDEYPNGATKLCLSCHDGATAIGTMTVGPPIAMNFDTLADRPASAFAILDPGVFNKTHPVSFVYSGAVITYINGAGGKSGYTAPTDPDVRLDGQNRMQCTTCHDPHRHTRKGGYTLPFWANKDTGFDSGNGGNNDYDNTCKQCHGVIPGTPVH